MVTHDLFALNRRLFLGRNAAGLGSIALSALGATAHANPVAHFAAKAKRVIFLYMSGGPSQFETFDNKPALVRHDGQPMPESVTQGQPIAQLQGRKLVCMAPQFKFERHGQSGQEISSVLPHIAKQADELCIIRSMHTDQINHDPAHTVMNTGTPLTGRPSLGSWVLYGLGSETHNLPGFIVLTSKAGRSPQPISARQWHSGFLPGQYQGVEFRSQGSPVLYLENPAGIDRPRQRDVVEAVATLNGLGTGQSDLEATTRTAQYEKAFRMQAAVPELTDFRDEPRHILDLYGTQGADGSFAANCLLARRLAERGVRFIQLYHRGWDHHNDLEMFMNVCAKATDQAAAALIQDLRQRGMLEDTLIVWSGEFGRTPMSQSGKGPQLGRDHHMRSFSLWMAGGGIRGGVTYGATDELGYHAAENPVHVHDLHATMLHLLGMDHRQLTYRAQGRDFRLTDVAGQVLHPLIG